MILDLHLKIFKKLEKKYMNIKIDLLLIYPHHHQRLTTIDNHDILKCQKPNSGKF